MPSTGNTKMKDMLEKGRVTQFTATWRHKYLEINAWGLLREQKEMAASTHSCGWRKRTGQKSL